MTQFSAWLRDFKGGAIDDQLTAAMTDVARAVQLLEKKGSVTLKLTLSERGGGVVVTPEVKHDVPQPATSGQFFYVADDGSLSRRDPNQPQPPSMEDQQK